MSKFTFAKVGRQPRSLLAETQASSGGVEVVNPWKSVNDMLIQNKCWLCEQVFARGKVKKVFMISHLLRYLEGRYGLESGELKMTVPISQKPEIDNGTCEDGVKGENDGNTHNAEDDDKMSTSGDVVEKETDEEKQSLTTSITTSPPSASTAPLVHIDMLKPLESPHLIAVYQAYKEMKGDKTLVAAELMKIECEVWMSGLICARTPMCASEYLLLVPDGKVSTQVMLGDPEYSSRIKNGECPPDCGCDNPWQYIEAALKMSEEV